MNLEVPIEVIDAEEGFGAHVANVGAGHVRLHVAVPNTWIAEGLVAILALVRRLPRVLVLVCAQES